MSTHHIPARDVQIKRLEQIQRALTETLRPFCKAGKLNDAVEAVSDKLRHLFKLPENPQLGAVVMTEAASMKNDDGRYLKGPKVV